MIELGQFDLRVLEVALDIVLGYNEDSLIRQTQVACPQDDPEDVVINVLAVIITAKDLRAYLAEVKAAEWEEEQ
jgi:hypothetical protein